MTMTTPPGGASRAPVVLLVALGAAALIIVAIAFRQRQPKPGPGPRPHTHTDARPHRDSVLPDEHGHQPMPAEEIRKLPAGSVALLATDGGKPVAEVQLGLWNEGLHHGLQGATDTTGRFQFEKVPVGEWTVFARHPRYVAAQQKLVVHERQTTQVALLLSAGGRLSGIVTNEAGQPIPDARVSILDVETKKLLHPSLRTTTGPAGEYTIEGIPLGRAGLIALAPKYRPQDRYDLVFATDGETRRLDLQLRAGTVISGRVVDDAGAPVAGAFVSAANEHTGTSSTDADGRFAIYGLGDNPAGLFAMKKGYGTAFLRGIPAGSSGVEFRLPKGATLSGRVEGAKPGPFFSVLFYRFEEDLGKELLIRTEPVRNSPDGSFLIADVAPGHYWISIDAAGLVVPVRAEIVVHPGASVSVQIAAEARK